MDTPWHVPQPHGKPFDLSLSDQEIYEYTENLIKENPSFSSQEAWRKTMSSKLDSLN